MKKNIKIILISLFLILIGYLIFWCLPKVIEDVIQFDWNNQIEENVIESNYFSAYKGVLYVKVPIGSSAFSFGIVGLGNKCRDNLTVRHEYGHYLQLKELGLYKYTKYIAIPSVKGAWGDVSYYEYYSQPWEYGAELYGEVNRVGYPYSDDVLEKYNDYWNSIK